MAEKHIADAESQFLIVNVTPDFCRIGGYVIPFDIMQLLQPEKHSYAKTVFARGEKVLMIDSVVKEVIGDAGEGVITDVSLVKGDSQITQGSSTVFVEGRQAARHLDEVWMNGVF